MKPKLATFLRCLANRVSHENVAAAPAVQFGEWKCGFCGAPMPEDFPGNHVRNASGVVPCMAA